MDKKRLKKANDFGLTPEEEFYFSDDMNTPISDEESIDINGHKVDVFFNQNSMYGRGWEAWVEGIGTVGRGFNKEEAIQEATQKLASNTNKSRTKKANTFSDLSVGDKFYFDWSEGPHANSLMVKVSPDQCKDLDENSPYYEYLFSVQPEQIVREALNKNKKVKVASIEDSIPQWALDELQNLVLMWFNRGSSFDDAMLYAVTDALSNPNLEAGIGQFNLENYEAVGLSDLIKQNLNITQDNPASETPVSDYTNPYASVNKQMRKASYSVDDLINTFRNEIRNPTNGVPSTSTPEGLAGKFLSTDRNDPVGSMFTHLGIWDVAQIPSGDYQIAFNILKQLGFAQNYEVQASSINKKIRQANFQRVEQFGDITAGYSQDDFKKSWLKDVINNPYNFDINNDNMFFDALAQCDQTLSTTVSWVKSVYDDAGVVMTTDEVRSLVEQWIINKGWNLENYS